MNPRIAIFLSPTEIRFRFPLLVGCALLVLTGVHLLIAEEHPSPDLTVHEWGTFTAVAGRDGNAMNWVTLRGATDLPGFVEHFSDANYKTGLRGTIRMETPVLYFYSSRDATVSVHVSLSKGIITEWYPHAIRTEPSEAFRTTDLRQLSVDGSIAWSGVTISPHLSGWFPREVGWNRYYAARETSSSPLSVATKAGAQQEKFLFYRGVSSASLPLSAKQNDDGELIVKSLGESELPVIILFERRGERIGYRVMFSPAAEVVLEPAELTSNLESLCVDLEGVLIDQGLYAEEAHAMVETWRDSWFEEGSRLIYVVPRGFVDSILPLTIEPAPSRMVRVFVGRLEIVTPATTKAVETALRSNDKVTLNKYGRFLEPILEMVRENSQSAKTADIAPRSRAARQ
jgi:hypothetical protein